jgi:hypothetical protein
MANRNFWAAMLAVALAFGMAVVGCDNGDPSDPALTGTISIIGTAQVGQTLTTNTVLGGSGTIFYQWKRGNTAAGTFSNITGAYTASYLLVEADLDKYIVVTVTRSGNSGSVTSSPTTVVVTNTLPALTGSVTITGTTTVGQTLTANTDSLGGTGTISYQWKRGNSATVAGTNITDATASTYTLVAADEARYITVTVTRSGNSGNVTSDPTNAVAAAPALTGTVSIIGTAKIGQTLTANTASLGGSGTISYQWRRAIGGSYSDITGANEGTYLLTTDDFNRYIAVVVTRAGNSGSVTSAATNPVADVMIWTQVSQSIFSSTNVINSVAHNGINLWVVIGTTSGGSLIASSTDGSTWTSSISIPQGVDGVSAYGGGRWIAGISYKGMWTSTTGQVSSWTQINVGSIFNASNERINDIAYGDSRWIVIGRNSNMMATSTDDGTTWTSVVSPLTTTTSIAYGNNRWVMVGLGNMATSTDGTNWTPIDVSSIFSGANSIYTVAYANNLWIAAGSGGRMATSTDGINWTRVPGTPFGTGTIRTVANGNNKWVAAATESYWEGGGSRIAFSSDGINWTSVANTTFGNNQVNSVAFGNGKWVAVGEGGKIAYANDD